MSSDLFRQMNGNNNFMQALNQLKSQGGDPNAMIQQMLRSGRVTQAQVNAAMQRAQNIMQMLPTSVRR